MPHAQVDYAKLPYPKDPTQYNRRDLYLGNANVRRSGSQPTRWTPELLAEYQRCKNDVEYFCSRYVKIIHGDHGLVNFKPYPYQATMWDNFEENRFNIVLACRQSGKTQGVVGYLAHYAIFNSEKLIALVAHERGQAIEILARITTVLENLPFFLQPGCKILNRGSIEFDHNTRIMTFAATSGSLRGKSVNLLYLDEFAFVEHDVKFMTGTYPVISSMKTSRVIITSTANGVGNQFHSIWMKAKARVNDYVPFQVDWWDVPGRDEAWKEQTINNTSKEQFEQEFGNSFLGTGNTLIDANLLANLVANDAPEWTGDDGVRVYEKPIKDTPEGDAHSYVMTVDVCKGRGKDYSTFTIFDTTVMPYKQVCTYRNSLISPLYYPDLLFKWAKMYNDALVVIESNDEGAGVARGLYYTLEYENVFVESLQKASGIGVFVDKKVKKIGCSRLKDAIETKQMLICDKDTIDELMSFGRKGDSYESTSPNVHDDMVANLWLMAWFMQTDLFQDHIGSVDLKQKLFEDRIRAIEESVPFFGVIGNATDGSNFMYERGYLPADFEDIDPYYLA